MKKMKHDVPTRLVKVLNLILMMAAFGFIWYVYYAARAQVHYYRRGDWVRDLTVWNPLLRILQIL